MAHQRNPIIVKEKKLSTMLDKVIAGNFLTGFSVDGEPSAPISVSRLLFADDTLIFVMRILLKYYF